VPLRSSLGGAYVFSADTAQANQQAFPPRCSRSVNAETISAFNRVQASGSRMAAACIDAPEMAQAPYGEQARSYSARALKIAAR